MRHYDASKYFGVNNLNSVVGDFNITDGLLVDFDGLQNLRKIGGDFYLHATPNLYNFQPLETAAKNMTGTWYVYGCGYNPTKYQMLNGESKPQE